MSLERWKKVDLYQGHTIRGNYEVSSWGNIRNADTGKYLKPLKSRRYYKYILKDLNNKNVHIKIHRLVAAAFLGSPEPGQEVNHIDGNPHNNSISNLEYVTHKENYEHFLAVRKEQAND